MDWDRRRTDEIRQGKRLVPHLRLWRILQREVDEGRLERQPVHWHMGLGAHATAPRPRHHRQISAAQCAQLGLRAVHRQPRTAVDRHVGIRYGHDRQSRKLQKPQNKTIQHRRQHFQDSKQHHRRASDEKDLGLRQRRHQHL